MDVRSLDLPDAKCVTPERHDDARGFFSETFNARRFEAAGLPTHWVQDNHARSESVGVLRGLHAQKPPTAQAKLVRVTAGAIFDVMVDARRGSPGFGRWTGMELTAENWRQIFVPEGFLHGYVTLQPGTEVLYKVTGFYAPDDEVGVRFDDGELGIDWPIEPELCLVSDKDRKLPAWAEFDTPFVWAG
jgi:dTDP-4-dehydrorhamnose 3,5-epimerase